MLRKVAPLVVIVALVAAVGVGSWFESRSVPTKEVAAPPVVTAATAKVRAAPVAPSVPEPPPEPDVLPPLVGIHEVVRAFDENEVAAEERFKSRVRLAGMVNSIEKTLLGHLVVTFRSPRTRRVTCRFDGNPRDLLSLKRGRLEIVECTGASPALLKGVVFEKCRLLDVADIADQYPTLIKKGGPGKFSVRGSLNIEAED